MLRVNMKIKATPETLKYVTPKPFSIPMASSDYPNTKNKREKSVPGAKQPKTKSKPKSRAKVAENDGAAAAAAAEPLPDIEDFGEDEVLQIRASLLDWYDRNRRDLPWRRTGITSKASDSDDVGTSEEEEIDTRAYAVWVSEVMLQQTRVQTVIDYYNRWMLKWPTLHHLAKASLEEVNEMWAGLGYYRRARFLLEGARMIAEHGGGFPKTVSGLLKVCGIGDYTAGAIASIAFNEAVPVVDGNVVRVIARLKAVSTNPKNSLAVKMFWKLAGQLVDPLRPGDFNQALMEFGAIACTPLSPSCSTCPIASQCHALSASKEHTSLLVTDYPVKVLKAQKRHDYSAVCVVEIVEGPQSESVIPLVKRPAEGLLAGLWEFPSVVLDGEADLLTRRNAIDFFLKESFNLDPKKTCSVVSREEIGVYVHVFSHIRLKMYVELLVLHLKGKMNVLPKESEKETMEWKYVDSKTLAKMGLTAGVKKVYTMIQKYKQKGVLSSPGHSSSRKKRCSRA